MPRSFVLSAAMVALCAAGCSSPSSGGAAPPDTAAPAAGSAAAPATAATPRSPADLFPDDPQKAEVISNCAACHNLACSVIGQRPAARWDALQASHADHVPGADVAAMFGYLKTHFNDSRPEPVVPPAFLEGGCTPF